MVNIVKELFWRSEPKEVVEEPKKLTARQRIQNRKRRDKNE